MDHHSQSWVVKMALFYSYCYHSIQTIIYTMTYHIISYYIILYHIISYYIILYPLILQPSPVNIYICIYIWRFPEIGLPPSYPFIDAIFHDIFTIQCSLHRSSEPPHGAAAAGLSLCLAGCSAWLPRGSWIGNGTPKWMAFIWLT
jgi:hypothetical protein